MDYFSYQNGEAFCEQVALAAVAEQVGTPCYVYSAATLRRHLGKLREAFASYPTLPCFAVKANSNLSVLREIFAQEFGADLVSVGELERSLLAGVNHQRIVFSGVGKRPSEIRRALEVGILSFNVESTYELELIGRLAAELEVQAPISLRVNPNIDARTNPKIATGLYTTKFGLTEDDVEVLAERIRQHDYLQLVGLACHIGSQITELAPLKEAAERMRELSQKLMHNGHALQLLNMGGGLGIRYRDEAPPGLDEYAATLIEAVRPTGLRLVIEPGRVVAGNIGILLTRVIGVKQTPAKHFVVVDAAMNDLLRPSMYGSYHDILPAQEPSQRPWGLCDFVGPICETGDILGQDRRIPLPAAEDLYMIRGCGAYAASMASQYNSRPRAAEVLVDGDRFRVVRPRETLASLWQAELDALD